MIGLGLPMRVLVCMAVTVDIEVFQVIAVRGRGKQDGGPGQAAHGLSPGQRRFVVSLIHHHEPQPAGQGLVISLVTRVKLLKRGDGRHPDRSRAVTLQ